MNLPALYHKGKSGSIYSWRVWTEGDFVITEYGRHDGKKMIAQKEAFGKNTGKRNATTSQQQAELEALAMHTFKLERKYSKTPEAAGEPLLLPMLAHDISKKLKKATFPGHVQPKLDGARCLAVCSEDGTITLLSRQGKEWCYVPHIQEQLANLVYPGTVLDGELYVHGVDFQTLMSWIKKSGKESNRVEFHVYDCPTVLGDDTRSWAERYKTLNTLAEVLSSLDFPNIFAVPTTTANSLEEAFELQNQYVLDGYEGAIFRNLSGLYTFGHRSSDLLKMKSFQDRDYLIIGYESGRGKNQDCVTWICTTTEGKEFRVSPKGTLQQRRDWLTSADSYVGRLLKVQYFELTNDGLPRFPVGIGIRLPEDES